ncbi:hypothetical protein GCM10012288_14150 [Malaciobacter pacificus]|nr:hypothetical protein GCM10012288_14150 [Malaciobacter pacificus]
MVLDMVVLEIETTEALIEKEVVEILEEEIEAVILEEEGTKPFLLSLLKNSSILNLFCLFTMNYSKQNKFFFKS